MEKKTEETNPKGETVTELEEQAQLKDEVKKGYNEKNPVQPQGAFIPDSEADSN